MNRLIELLVYRAAQNGIEVTPDELREALYQLLAGVRKKCNRPRGENNIGTMKWLMSCPLPEKG